MVEVVSAVIIRDGRILLTQRRPEKDFPFTWECPGGKVNGLHESHHSALQRELREELGLEEIGAIANNPIWCNEFVLPRPVPAAFDPTVAEPQTADTIFLLMYRVELKPHDPSCDCTQPEPLEGQGIGWFTAKEMRKLTLAPGNQRAIEAICSTMAAVERALLTERPL